jgi:V/A-type H+-transporting ATPase subunit D
VRAVLAEAAGIAAVAEKFKKTNPELLRQRRALSRYERFLPTLLLKKQLIQAEIQGVRRERAELQGRLDRRLEEIEPWLGFFGEPLPGPITRLVSVAGVETGERTVAGIPLPVLKEISWDLRPYSLTVTPSWVEAGVEFVKELLQTREALRISMTQELVLDVELRKVTQRVNLFEKVMIPFAREAIRVIRIALAEEQTAGVGRAKIAKAKKELAARGAS